MIFVGDDWSERHHDIEVHDDQGRRLARGRLGEGAQGAAQLHLLLAEHAADPGEVVVGTETDRGLWVASLVAAGYTVFALNPKVVARYRHRHAIAGAKSDAGDAKLLADIVRVDRHNHRSVSGDSDLVEAVKIVARAHRRLVWARQRQQNTLRAALLQFYPAAVEAFGNELAHPDAVTVLAAAPTPAQGRRLSLARLESLLRKAGRSREVTARACALQDALRSQQLTPAALLEAAHGVQVAAIVAILEAMNTQVAMLEAELAARFADHPDADIVRSQPGLGTLVGSRLLGEFGDDHQRFADAKAPQNATPAPPRSPSRRARRSSCGHAWPATATSPTPATGGRFAR